MRFHVGFSFRLKNVVKFLIPILIGIGAYFGLPVLFGCIKVNALVNTNTSYDFTIVEDIPQSTVDILQDIIDDFGVSEYYDLIINYKSPYDNTYLYFATKSSYHSVYVYKEYSFVGFYIDNNIFDYISFPPDYDLTSSSDYNTIKSCYLTGDFSNCYSFTDSNLSGGTGSASPYVLAYDIYNDDNFTAVLDQYYYYSSSPLYYYINSNNSSSENVFYKTLYINYTLIEEGDTYPTYYSLFIGEPEPEPPEPSQEGIVNNVYWFYDNVTEYDVLVNIYILLFLYCFAMIILKLLMIVKGVKW